MSSSPSPAPSPNWSSLPIFPLNTVLFPDSLLGLRVFEPRYIDMTRECMREQRPFGIALIRQGKETGEAAIPHEVGCLAHVQEWDMPHEEGHLGLLHLLVRGGQRFRLTSTHVEANKLLRGVAIPVSPEPFTAIRPLLASCVVVLRGILTQIPENKIPLPHEFDNATWVGNRLSEILPLPLHLRQGLMELGAVEGAINNNAADARLELIHHFLIKQGLLKK